MLVQFRHMVRRNSRIELRGLSRRSPLRVAEYLAPQAAQTRTKRSPDSILPWRRFGTRPGHRRLPKDLCRELEASRELSRFCSRPAPACRRAPRVATRPLLSRSRAGRGAVLDTVGPAGRDLQAGTRQTL